MSLSSDWVDSQFMADHLGLHKQTLLRQRRSRVSPFKEGRDYRWSGLTTGGSLHWHLANTDKAFTNFRRLPTDQVETFRRRAFGLVGA